MPDRLRVAVIGAGVMGQHHMRVYRELADADLIAIADTSEAALAGADIRGYQDYRQLLDQERIDAVSIAVPARMHHDVALACLERGIATLVEKPIAATVAEGESLRDAARRNNSPLMVGHVERFNPAVRELKRRLSSGELGCIHEALARRVGPFFPRERDIGVVHDLATHDIDLLRYFLGCNLEQALAETQQNVRTAFEDAVLGTLRFQNGTVAQIEANWLSPVKQRELTLIGERGAFALDYIAQSLTFIPQSSNSAGDAEMIEVPDAGGEPLRAELAAFLRAAKGQEPPAITAEDGIAAVRVADALVESGRTGQTVQLIPPGSAK